VKEISLRLAEEKDIDMLVNALSASNSREISLEVIESCKNRMINEVNGLIPNSKTYVIEHCGESVGRLRLVETEKEFFLGGIQLLPKDQGKGLGSSILKYLIAQTSNENKCLRLEVEKSNPKAKKLYLNCGFVVEQDFEDKERMIRSI
jgi:GNAT superfamily N-acetyltransferase